MDWTANVILTVLADPVWQGLNRLLRGRPLAALIWFLTGGFFGIGWLIDIYTVVTQKDIRILA
jgi:hypothetical protein